MNGVLVIDKPEGFTSHDVVGKVRRILKMKSVGHTGTLDPFATGVLVVLVGKATRLAQFLDKAEKDYLATIQFGWETDTGDRTGNPKSEVQSPKPFSREEIETVLNDFRGEVWQTPPMYSAKKVQGKKLYELARKGEEIERQPVKITISELQLIDFDQSAIRNPQSAIVKAVCSAGTYVRVLAEDIGRKLNSAAHLAELRRTRAGSFTLSQAGTLDDLENLAAVNQTSGALVSPNEALGHLPLRVLSKGETEKIINGVKIEAAGNYSRDGEFVRLCDSDANLIAVAVWEQTEMTLKPRVVLGARAEND